MWVSITAMPQSALATAARYSLFPHGHRLADHDGIFIVGAAVPGGFTVSMRESGCATALGGYLHLPALAGEVSAGELVEVI